MCYIYLFYCLIKDTYTFLHFVPIDVGGCVILNRLLPSIKIMFVSLCNNQMPFKMYIYALSDYQHFKKQTIPLLVGVEMLSCSAQTHTRVLSLHSQALPCGGRIPSTTRGAPVSEPRHQTHPEF